MVKRIMMVDDSRTTRDMVAFTLARKGYHVVQAGDGAAALGVLKTESVDLVITDLNMPVMDGLSLIKALRGQAAYATVPIVMLSTESDAGLKAQGTKAGATHWLEKPFHPNQLSEMIGQLMPPG
jgi:two-component system chemotaxis response regulator CheY